MQKQHATMGWFQNQSALSYEGSIPLAFEAGVLHPNTFNGEVFLHLCDKMLGQKWWLLKNHDHNELKKVYEDAFKPCFDTWVGDNGELLFHKYLHDKKLNKEELTYERVMSFLAMFEWFVLETKASLLFCF